MARGDLTQRLPVPRRLMKGPAHGLTHREVEVLRELARGKRNADVAQELSISPHTVRTHVQNLLAKLDVSSRLGAAAAARELGLMDPQSSTAHR
jgi:DNA-binding CsgD family transcriptional regulator